MDSKVIYKSKLTKLQRQKKELEVLSTIYTPCTALLKSYRRNVLHWKWVEVEDQENKVCHNDWHIPQPAHDRDPSDEMTYRWPASKTNNDKYEVSELKRKGKHNASSRKTFQQRLTGCRSSLMQWKSSCSPAGLHYEMINPVILVIPHNRQQHLFKSVLEMQRGLFKTYRKIAGPHQRRMISKPKRRLCIMTMPTCAVSCGHR